MTSLRISLGPLLYYWPFAQVAAFYEAVAEAPVDIVYLGEVVCGKRHELKLGDWIDIGRRLARSGKEVVLSTLALPESEADLRAVRRLIAEGGFTIEANDMGAVGLAIAARLPFVIGPHVNAYHPATTAYLARRGAVRWVAPVELGRDSLLEANRHRPAALETEVLGYGRLPLAFSARCFTARAHGIAKDACEFRCLDDPDGITVTTLDHVPAFVLNGIQTQSARPYSLVPALAELAPAGVNVVRISPAPRHTLEIIALVRECLAGERAPDAAGEAIQRLTGGVASSGYWYGKPGLHVRQASASRSCA